MSLRNAVVAVSTLRLMGLLGIGFALWIEKDDPRLTWRREIVALKLLGSLPGESWASVVQRIRPLVLGKPFEFEGMRLDAVGAYGADTEGGRELFRQHCESCHGVKGEAGKAGVDLSNPERQTRLSDLDIYMALTRGIRGTNMPPFRVTATEGLQLTAYVRSLKSKGGPQEQPAADADADCERCKDIDVSAEDVISGPARGAWLSYSGDYTGQRFSPLTQIDKTNVSRLRPRFVHQLKSLAGLQATPLVANGVLFMTGPENEVVALDLATGNALWT